MIKRIIKLAVLAMAVTAIGYSVYYFSRAILMNDVEPVVLSDMEQEIRDSIESRISHQPYPQATMEYDQAREAINILHEQRLKNGERALDDRNAEKCLRVAYDAYAPIFIAYTNNYFRRNDWDTATINELRDRAMELQAVHDTVFYQEMVKVVDDYYAAWTFVGVAEQKCWNVDSIKNRIQKANEFIYAPLKNNKALYDQLNQIPERVKQKYKTYVKQKGDKIIDKVYNNSYTDYGEFQKDYDNISKNFIRPYERAYGNAFGNLKDRLNKADDEIQRRIRERETNNTEGQYDEL